LIGLFNETHTRLAMAKMRRKNSRMFGEEKRAILKVIESLEDAKANELRALLYKMFDR